MDKKTKHIYIILAIFGFVTGFLWLDDILKALFG